MRHYKYNLFLYVVAKHKLSRQSRRQRRSVVPTLIVMG